MPRNTRGSSDKRARTLHEQEPGGRWSTHRPKRQYGDTPSPNQKGGSRLKKFFKGE